MPATIDDPVILDEISTVLRERHIGRPLPDLLLSHI